MIRRLNLLRLLIALVLVADLAAVGAHEIAVHSRPCWFGLWRVPQCQVLH